MKPELPSSDAFWVAAEAYLGAAIATHNLQKSEGYAGFATIPATFLYFRSIELTLKACLVAHEIDEKTITKDLGHRLTKLREKLVEKRAAGTLGILDEFQDFLDQYSDYYSQKRFEYPENPWIDMPELGDLRSFSCDLLESAREYRPSRCQ